MSKRKRFVLVSLILSLGFVGIQFLDNQYKFLAIGFLALLTAIGFVWSLREGLGKDMTLITLVLPAMFTLGVGLFWFLLPASVFTRLPIMLFYASGIYVLFLTMNIFTISAIRTIALLRAARGVGFVLTLVTSFLIFDAILSIKTFLPVSMALVYLSSFLLLFQGLWHIPLETGFRKDVLFLTLVFSLVVTEVVMCIFFWPVKVVVGSLFLTSTIYVLLGLGQAKLETRLFSQTVRDYLVVGLMVFIGMFVATQWGA